MRHAKMNCISVMILLMVLAFSIVLPSSPCSAQKLSNMSNKEWAFPEFYPKKFDGEGYINRITSDIVVIDDRLHRFSHFTKFATPTRKKTRSSRFHAGDLVGYTLNSKNEIESMWLLKK
jgi:hypothetical protein